MGVRVLAGIAQQSESDAARVRAIELLFERGWGKAPTTHTGEDGEGAIQVIIRHIVESGVEPRALDGRASPRVIDQRRPTDGGGK